VCCRASAKDTNEGRKIDETVELALQKFTACEEKIKQQKLKQQQTATNTTTAAILVKQNNTTDNAAVKNAQGPSSHGHAGAPKTATPRMEKHDNGKSWTDWIADGLGLGAPQNKAKDVAYSPKPTPTEQTSARQNYGEANRDIQR
jgi:hypothetical protein